MGVPKENLRIVGAMQQDYGREIFSDYYLPRAEIAEEFELDDKKPWILFISSFAYATFPENALKSLAEKYGETIYVSAKLHRESQTTFLDWVEEFLKRCDSEFIYRPHPSERLAVRLGEMREKYKNFHVISERSVKQWAKVSDRVNLWISTSNAEIASMGIDYSIIRPLPVPDEKEVESMRDETFVEDMEEFIDLNMNLKEPSMERVKERQQKLTHFYNYDEEKAAYERLADYLIEVYNSKEGQKFKFKLKDKIYAKYRELRIRLASRIGEQQLKKPNKKIIDKAPVKKVIKENLHKSLDKHNQKTIAEERMMEYLRSHGQKT